MLQALIQRKKGFLQLGTTDEEKAALKVMEKNQQVREMVQKNYGIDPRLHDISKTPISKIEAVRKLHEKFEEDKKGRMIKVSVNKFFRREYAAGIGLISRKTSNEVYTPLKNGVVICSKKPLKVNTYIQTL